jgi:hypothetical protein
MHIVFRLSQAYTPDQNLHAVFIVLNASCLLILLCVQRHLAQAIDHTNTLYTYHTHFIQFWYLTQDLMPTITGVEFTIKNLL